MTVAAETSNNCDSMPTDYMTIFFYPIAHHVFELVVQAQENYAKSSSDVVKSDSDLLKLQHFYWAGSRIKHFD